jgi:hydrogenase expression/formation protein HypE
MNRDKVITMVHGSGGQATGDLIGEIFTKEFDNGIQRELEDSAVVSGCGRIAITTDSFVVTPLEFNGGDIGRLSVCGTVNDLLMRGAIPKYLTCGFILEEGLEVARLQRIVHSMAKTAMEAGVQIVAGDTKVVEGNGGLYINTSGVGFVPEGVNISASKAKEGDLILVSGTMGDHHAAILSERLTVDTDIVSDNAPLVEMVLGMIKAGVNVHVLRDITRGGLGTVLKELAVSSEKVFYIEEDKVPVTDKVRDFCGLLGMDPIYMGNEGKLVAIVAPEDRDKALGILRNSAYGENAEVIGYVAEPKDTDEIYDDKAGDVIMRTLIGGKRSIDVLQGEGLPRIC